MRQYTAKQFHSGAAASSLCLGLGGLYRSGIVFCAGGGGGGGGALVDNVVHSLFVCNKLSVLNLVSV